MSQLPADVFKAVAQFLAEGKTGRIVLDVKCGEIQRWDLTESFRRQSQRPDWVDSGGAVGILSQSGQERTK